MLIQTPCAKGGVATNISDEGSERVAISIDLSFETISYIDAGDLGDSGAGLIRNKNKKIRSMASIFEFFNGREICGAWVIAF